MSNETTAPTAPAEVIKSCVYNGHAVKVVVTTLTKGKGKGRVVCIPAEPSTDDEILTYFKIFPNLRGAFYKHTLRASGLEASQPDIVVSADNIDGDAYFSKLNEDLSVTRQANPVKQAEEALATFNEEHIDLQAVAMDFDRVTDLKSRSNAGDTAAAQELAELVRYKQEFMRLNKALQRARNEAAAKKAKTKPAKKPLAPQP